MADPLRRTLLAKLRGKKSKKGDSLCAGLDSTANVGREGKDKVSETERDFAEACPPGSPGSLSGPDVMAERTSTYENWARGAPLAGACPPQLGGVRVERELQSGGGSIRESHVRVSICGSGGVSFGEAPNKPVVSVPWQCSVGDSIGFGANSSPNHSGERTGFCTPADRGRSQHVPRAVVGGNMHNTNKTRDSQQSSDTSVVCADADEILFRTIESLDPAYPGDLRCPLQSPAFFPTELDICDINLASVCAAKGPRGHPFDGEDDDYYDNAILPFYEALRAKGAADRDVPPPHTGQDDGSPSAQETDRLRNQLKEAYYLLLNAMNDISLEIQQVGSSLNGHQTTSSCSSRSRDSLCSRLSAKIMDSESWSSGGDPSPQQVSDTDSLLLCLNGDLELDLKSTLNSKSTENLSVAKLKPTLVRSASDGAIRYTAGPLMCTSPLRTGPVFCDEDAIPALKSDNKREDADVKAAGECLSFQEAAVEENQSEQLAESSGSVNSLTGSSDSNTEVPANPDRNDKRWSAAVRAQGADSVNKGHGVTVNKMQAWMHKGRLLSSEMKQRIEGSSSARRGSHDQERPSLQATHGALCKPGVQTSSRVVQSVKSPWQPALIENVQTELSTWRPNLHTITVAKKRNWLQQSSLGKNSCTKDELQGTLGAEEEACQCSTQLPPSPSTSPEQLRNSGGASSHPDHPHLPKPKASPHPRSVDPAEENDADDEGEIWYNPIPEDDELEVSNRPSVRLLIPHRAELQKRPNKGRDAIYSGRTLEISGSEPHEESSSADGNQGNAAHSTEALHLHRQMLACKPQEEGGHVTSKSIDVLDMSNTLGFSPPSSPNPTKKNSSITWSFPDKIKSPRTVRKLSMKMKKLPELSRKLSVKGQSSSNANGSGHIEHRSQSLRATGGGSEATQTSGSQRLAASGVGQASRNVISRYHLDSSVSTQHSFDKKRNSGSSKSASKGGYLSDGDSPELVAKSGKHNSVESKGGRSKDTDGTGGSPKSNGTDLDIDAFRHYSFTEQPKCSQYISGLMSLHFYGAEDLKPPRIDSRDVYCAIQVDSVNKARTALLTCRTTFLDMDHTFNIELENAQHLKLVVFSWEPMPRRNRVCCHGTVVLPALFRVTRFHQLAVKLEPRGLIYVKLGLMEQWQNSLDGRPDGDREPQVFGVEAWRVVEREDTGLMVPLLISKCINEIEKRGYQVVGLYRLCGSAAVKKELREAFERDSHAVELCENTYPDINVITGVLKDYLRELPYPLITKQLYEAVLDSMASRPLRMGSGGCENDHSDSEHTVSLLDNLPEVERMTLRKLLDHLKLVASHQEVNKMTCQNLAVCFGPVLLSQRQEASCHSNRVFIDSEELASALHFKKHIEVLHYLLQLWPVVDAHDRSSSTEASSAPASDSPTAPPLRRRKERPQVLNLTEAEMAGVLRPKAGRLDSPSNRYAGDWSGCGESYFPSELPLAPGKEEADYDDVPSEDTETERPEDAEEATLQELVNPLPDPAEQEQTVSHETVQEEEEQPEPQEQEESNKQLSVKEEMESMCEHILPPRLPKEHTYQAYMKIQDISPVLSNRVNLRDLQESIDTLIGNLERELNKNKINVGY